jgi:hypothetical protein
LGNFSDALLWRIHHGSSRSMDSSAAIRGWRSM